MNSKSSAPRTIRITIERLVLDGLPVSERQTAQVRAAFEREVSQLLTRDGVPSAWERGGAVARQEGGLFAIPRGASPAQMGLGRGGDRLVRDRWRGRWFQVFPTTLNVSTAPSRRQRENDFMRKRMTVENKKLKTKKY